MKTPKHSLRKIVRFLNNPDEDGGFWLPNIQRSFVWGTSYVVPVKKKNGSKRI